MDEFDFYLAPNDEINLELSPFDELIALGNPVDPFSQSSYESPPIMSITQPREVQLFPPAPAPASLSPVTSNSPTTISSPPSPNAPKQKRKRDRVGEVPDSELSPQQLAKRQRRRELNKISAQNSRHRKFQRITDLECDLSKSEAKNADLQSTVNRVVEENEMLKQLLQSHGISIPALARAGMFGLFSVALIVMVVYAPTMQSPLDSNPTHPIHRGLKQAPKSLENFKFANPASASLRKDLETFDDIEQQSASSEHNIPEQIIATSTIVPTVVEINTSQSGWTESSKQLPMASTVSVAPTHSYAEMLAAQVLQSAIRNEANGVMTKQNLLAAVVRDMLEGNEWTHRYGELDPAAAVKYISDHGLGNTQYLICSAAHAVTLTRSSNTPTTTTTPTSTVNCQVQSEVAGSTENTTTQVLVEDTEASMVNVSGQRLSMIVPPGMVAPSSAGLCEQQLSELHGLEEVVLSTGWVRRFDQDADQSIVLDSSAVQLPPITA
eukprot:c39269_g1_i1.p1 GENE.c39269_g1_i1~~c39269_g1_i1.p1  ORF type:complete len:495 (+),score=121.31 c39269_g1_i1:57-1541(+)